MNFDVHNDGAGSSWQMVDTAADCQLIPPGGSARLKGTFTGPNDAITVIASPVEGGNNYACLLNELQAIGLTPTIDNGNADALGALTDLQKLPDYASASLAVNQAEIDYANQNWVGFSQDLSTMGSKLQALAQNKAELGLFATYAGLLCKNADSNSIATAVSRGANIGSVANLFYYSPDVLIDFFLFDAGSSLHGGVVYSVFRAYP